MVTFEHMDTLTITRLPNSDGYTLSDGYDSETFTTAQEAFDSATAHFPGREITVLIQWAKK